MVDVVVDQRGQEVVSQADGIEVAGEMQIDVFHGHHLRHAAAGRAALHAKYRAQAGLAQANNGFLADTVQCIAQAHGGSGLALAGRCGADGGDQNQFAVGALVQAVHILQRHLGFVAAIGIERIVRNTEPCGDLADGLHGGLLGDFDV